MLAPLSESNTASVFAPRATIDADGTVEGYASLFGELDQARDMMMRGAFAETLRAHPLRAHLFQQSVRAGRHRLELREDHRGLFARGRPFGVARGRELLSLLWAGRSTVCRSASDVKARIDPGPASAGSAVDSGKSPLSRFRC